MLRSLHLDGAVPARRSPVPSIGIVWVESSLQRKPRRSSPRPRAPVKGRGRRPGVTAVGGWLRSRSAACGRCSEAEQGQRSAFCKRATSRAAKAGHRNPDWVKIIPRIERQSLRHPIRRAAQQFYRSLRCPVFAAGVASACRPLALSQFSLRAAERPCENWSAAPAAAPCFVHRTRSPPLPLLRFGCFCRRQRLSSAAPLGQRSVQTGPAARTAPQAKRITLF